MTEIKIIQADEIDEDSNDNQTPPGIKVTLSDGSYYYDNRTDEEMSAAAAEIMKDWDKENPEEAAAIDLRIDNKYKYRKLGVYHQEIPKDYLHQQSYEARLAKAETLNGCKFKASRPYKSKAWGEPMDRVLHDKDDGFGNLCDGQIATLGRLNGFVTSLLILQFFAVLFALFLPIIDLLWVSPLLLLLAIGMNYFKNVVECYDQFVFERHTGLVKTPHNWFRRSFYIPYEDIECYDGGTVKSARGGGARETAKIRCLKTPKRYYLFAPQYILRFGGLDQGGWAGYLEFMDINTPVNPNLHRSIEYYYTIDKNALETGPFPAVMKQYLDPDDKQVNREHVW
ncbi:hypothetical protein GCM10009111_25850 [Colwellia asteriadis]|uniref:Transmembrane protein n=1 Tax=Colwellia asteriadis TaxID=517723 RepID=A0ABN1L911_9GAMM